MYTLYTLIDFCTIYTIDFFWLIHYEMFHILCLRTETMGPFCAHCHWRSYIYVISMVSSGINVPVLAVSSWIHTRPSFVF